MYKTAVWGIGLAMIVAGITRWSLSLGLIFGGIVLLLVANATLCGQAKDRP